MHFEIVNGMNHIGVSDLRDVVGEKKRSDEGEVFAEYMNYLYKEVKLKMKQSNQNYKKNVDKTRRHHIF